VKLSLSPERKVEVVSIAIHPVENSCSTVVVSFPMHTFFTTSSEDLGVMQLKGYLNRDGTYELIMNAIGTKALGHISSDLRLAKTQLIISQLTDFTELTVMLLWTKVE
jgi:hypothetical protein